MKFTPAGGRVAVNGERPDENAVLSVSDTGIGISKEKQEQLFERFIRASGATHQAIQGTGRGLFIAKTIVEAHAGTIAVESEEGLGTTFRVELPFAGRSERSSERRQQLNTALTR